MTDEWDGLDRGMERMGSGPATDYAAQFSWLREAIQWRQLTAHEGASGRYRILLDLTKEMLKSERKHERKATAHAQFLLANFSGRELQEMSHNVRD